MLLLSPHQDEVLVSDESVIISTLAQGKPGSSPKIVRAVPIDHTRILISWEPGPFSNGALLSYVIQIRNINSNDFTALKVNKSIDFCFYFLPQLSSNELRFSFLNIFFAF